MSANHDSETLGWASASQMHRLENCPGSFALSKQAPPEAASEYASIGTRIHAALADRSKLDGLSIDEQDAFNRCVQIENRLVGAVLGWANVTPDSVERERRLWSASLEVTGQADVIYRGAGSALVIDYKTGRGTAEPAETNAQLRTLAVLLWLTSSTRSESPIYVAIIAPHQHPDVTVSVFGARELQRALVWLQRTIRKTKSKRAKRKPGAWCQFCPARGICPEFGSQATALVKPAVESGALSTVPSASEVEAIKYADKQWSTWRDERIRLAKLALTDDPNAIPGRRIEKLDSVRVAFERARDAGVTPEAFADACTLTKTAAAKMADSLGMAGANAKAFVEDLWRDNCTVTTAEPALEVANGD
jgi:Protein of unknown function (DUF2800)